MFPGNDKHPDIWRHLGDWLTFSVFIGKIQIMQTQHDYMLDDDKQISDNVHRIANIWEEENRRIQPTAQMFGIILNQTLDSRRWAKDTRKWSKRSLKQTLPTYKLVFIQLKGENGFTVVSYLLFSIFQDSLVPLHWGFQTHRSENSRIVENCDPPTLPRNSKVS